MNKSFKKMASQWA